MTDEEIADLIVGRIQNIGNRPDMKEVQDWQRKAIIHYLSQARSHALECLPSEEYMFEDYWTRNYLGMDGVMLSKKDIKKAIADTIETLRDRMREKLGAGE